jgi:hypothetical protein
LTNFLVVVLVILAGSIFQLVGLFIDNKILEKYGKTKQRQYRIGLFSLVLLSMAVLPFLLF